MKKDSQKSIEKNRQNVACDYIRENYAERLRYDVISQKVQIFKPHPETGVEQWFYVTNADINSIVCDANFETGVAITNREVLTVLNAGEKYISQVNPLKEYVLSLAPYSGTTDWIAWLASQVTVAPGSEELWYNCFKRWFIGMVAGWLYDDVVNQSVIVLVGSQAKFKTTFLDRLLPSHLRNYGCKMSISNQLNRDERLRLSEFGLINLDELDTALTPKELNIIKSIITCTDINERSAYAYCRERRVRIASFCGSTNRREFLTDLTGNRRFLPFEVLEIANPYDNLIPYNMVYAQARHLLETGFNYWFDYDDVVAMHDHTDSFRAQENEEQILPLLFAVPAEGKGVFMTTAQISERLVSFGNVKKPMSTSRLGMVLSAAGFQAVRKQVGGVRLRGWAVYQRNSEEINAMRNLEM